MIRLDKFLCDSGLGTRSEVKKIIKSGQVFVNDNLTKDNGMLISKEDKVIACGKEVFERKPVYLMLNKPEGVVTANKDNLHKTVMDLIPVELRKGVSAVGRLDIDTTGLLLLTDDGALNHHLVSPAHHVNKCYEVDLLNPFDDNQKLQLENGVDLGNDEWSKEAVVEIVSDKKILLTITEGKFHQVKRMLHAVNNEVVGLKRISMGSLRLDGALGEGEYRELTTEEIKLLKE